MEKSKKYEKSASTTTGVVKGFGLRRSATPEAIRPITRNVRVKFPKTKRMMFAMTTTSNVFLGKNRAQGSTVSIATRTNTLAHFARGVLKNDIGEHGGIRC